LFKHNFVIVFSQFIITCNYITPSPNFSGYIYENNQGGTHLSKTSVVNPLWFLTYPFYKATQIILGEVEWGNFSMFERSEF